MLVCNLTLQHKAKYHRTERQIGSRHTLNTSRKKQGATAEGRRTSLREFCGIMGHLTRRLVSTGGVQQQQWHHS